MKKYTMCLILLIVLQTVLSVKAGDVFYFSSSRQFSKSQIATVSKGNGLFIACDSIVSVNLNYKKIVDPGDGEYYKNKVDRLIPEQDTCYEYGDFFVLQNI